MSPNDINNLIRVVMDFDPADAALKQTEPYSALGLQITKNVMLASLMAETRDVSSDMSFSNYLKVAIELGFKVVHEERFKNCHNNYFKETYLVLWHDTGFLLTLESYESNFVNTANLHYNINVPADRKLEFLISDAKCGAWVRDAANTGLLDVWYGYRDVRNGLRYFMGLLGKYHVLNRWIASPILWLGNFSDCFSVSLSSSEQRDEHLRATTLRKINEMPKDLREMLLACTK